MLKCTIGFSRSTLTLRISYVEANPNPRVSCGHINRRGFGGGRAFRRGNWLAILILLISCSNLRHVGVWLKIRERMERATSQ